MGSVNAPATGKEITVKRVSKERKDFLSGYFLFQPPPPPLKYVSSFSPSSERIRNDEGITFEMAVTVCS